MRLRGDDDSPCAQTRQRRRPASSSSRHSDVWSARHGSTEYGTCFAPGIVAAPLAFVRPSGGRRAADPDRRAPHRACSAGSASAPPRPCWSIRDGSAAAPSRRRAGSARAGRRPRARASRGVQPASRYSSIASMQSDGVPAIGRHLSSSASETSAFAARRPPCSIASATGRISSCSMPASSSSVSAEPWMFCTLFARYMPAISRAPSRPASRSSAWIEATTVQPTSISPPTLLARVADERRAS